MSEIHTFKSGDKKFIFSVKREFLNKCGKPDTINTYELMTTYKLNLFLHNPAGPAIIRLKDNIEEYWLDGMVVSKEVGEKIAHAHQFNNKLDNVINED